MSGRFSYQTIPVKSGRHSNPHSCKAIFVIIVLDNSISLLLDLVSNLPLVIAGREGAADDPDHSEDEATPHQARTYQLQLHRLEPLLSQPHEGDDQTHGHCAQPHV